eukprot:9483640-Pyramimonas_sp.AAC.1
MHPLSIVDPSTSGCSKFSKPSAITANFEPCGARRAPAPAATAANRAPTSPLERSTGAGTHVTPASLERSTTAGGAARPAGAAQLLSYEMCQGRMDSTTCPGSNRPRRLSIYIT